MRIHSYFSFICTQISPPQPKRAVECLNLNFRSLFLKLLRRYALDSWRVLERDSHWSSWFRRWSHPRNRDRWTRLMEPKCAEGGREISERQANQATRTYLRVHHDREAPLPNASSHAKSLSWGSSTLLRSPAFAENVPSTSRFAWTAFRVGNNS